MELPRNITQVGETDRNCKIYVEDYAVSYMKQMNKFAGEKEISVALYGKMSVEQQITYCFVYGACVVASISRDVRHLSQAQNQEIERMRKKYFPEQIFLGYQILNGEMIEGFRIYDQNSCRYVKGYACFFEKNDSMLAYMLENRQEEVRPERVEQEKYEEVKRRQEDRRLQFEGRGQGRKYYHEKRIKEEDAEKNEKSKESEKFKVAPFVLLAGSCLIAIGIWGNNPVFGTVKEELLTWMNEIKENETLLPKETDNIILGKGEKEEVQAVMGTLVTEEKLVEAILAENKNSLIGSDNEGAADAVSGTAVEEQKGSDAPLPEEGQTELKVPQVETEQMESSKQPPEEDQTVDNMSSIEETQTETSKQPMDEGQTDPSKHKNSETYTIRQGDTLIAISKNKYGSDTYVSEICMMNNISDPDNIQIGQKILLP